MCFWGLTCHFMHIVCLCMRPNIQARKHIYHKVPLANICSLSIFSRKWFFLKIIFHNRFLLVSQHPAPACCWCRAQHVTLEKEQKSLYTLCYCRKLALTFITLTFLLWGRQSRSIAFALHDASVRTFLVAKLHEGRKNHVLVHQSL